MAFQFGPRVVNLKLVLQDAASLSDLGAPTSSPGRLAGLDTARVLNVLANLVNAYGNGGPSSLEVQVDNGAGTPTAASQTVTISGAVSAADTVTLNGVVFTARAAPSTSLEWFSGLATATLSALSLAQAINAACGTQDSTVPPTGATGTVGTSNLNSRRPDLQAIYGKFVASVAAGVVTITSREISVLGNAATLAESGVNIAVGGATLAGGTAPTANFYR